MLRQVGCYESGVDPHNQAFGCVILYFNVVQEEGFR